MNAERNAGFSCTVSRLALISLLPIDGSLTHKLIKIGCKAVCHARYVTFQLAELAIPRSLFQAILRRLSRLHATAMPLPRA